MGTLTDTNLVEVDFGRLGTAVSDWKTTRDELKKIADDARTGMLAKSEAARWEGLNATVTRDFVKKTAKELDDLQTEANSIWNVLDDAQTELAALQRSVKTIAAEAKEANFRVDDNGDGTVRVSYDYPDGPRGAYSPEDRQALQKQGNGFAERIKGEDQPCAEHRLGRAARPRQGAREQRARRRACDVLLAQRRTS